MASLQQEVRNYFVKNNIPYEDHTEDLSPDKLHLDFMFLYQGERSSKVHLEVKEKKQPYNLSNWGIYDMPEHDVFIIDDLSIRKLVFYGPRSCILIRSNYGDYYLLRCVDVCGLPKIRVNRPIERTVLGYKGKWIIRLSDLIPIGSIPTAFSEIIKYLVDIHTMFFKTTECVGNYQSENLAQAGRVRTAQYWEKDLAEAK